MTALDAVCDTFVPAADGLPAASALGVPRRIRAEVAALRRSAEVRLLDQLEGLLSSRLGGLLLAGIPARFADLPFAERERYLRRMAASPLPTHRTAFQALKRLTYLYAYGTDGSPYARAAGYAPPPLDPPAAPRVTAREPRGGEVIEADACVIGSGAGGAVAAAALAAAGRRVVVLERARLRSEADFDGRELAGFASLFVDRGIAATADRAIVLLAGSAVGGGTVVNWNTSLRLADAVREEWRAAGVDGLDEHYEAVERRIHVNQDESHPNGPNSVLERGLTALGLPYSVTRRNVEGCGDCGPCTFGCRRGAKRSVMRTYLADAVQGGAEILHTAEAVRILVDGDRVSGVVARAAGGEVTVRAPLVALAGGALLSPALLLRSGIAAGRAGRGLHLHPVAVVLGDHPDPVPAWTGVPQARETHAFARLDGAYGFLIEAVPSYPGIAAAVIPWWGEQLHRSIASRGDHLAALIAVVRDRESGRVELARDGSPVVRYRVQRETARLLERGMAEIVRIQLAAGARRAITLHTPPLEALPGSDLASFDRALAARGIRPNGVGLFSAHQMSSCRIGPDRRTAVARPDGRAWDVRGLYVTDASAFPSASGVNPMLTVMALARRTAREMLAAS